MSQIKRKFITNDAVNGAKIRLDNNENLKARNQANSANIDIVKVNASDRIEFASVPQSPADASSANDLVRFSQLATLVEGLKPKQAVRAATTGPGTLASDFENGDIIDGVTLATGDRILIKDQSSAAENGIYVVQASGAPVRADDFNAPSEIPGSYTVAQEGTANQGTLFVCLSSPAVIGTDPISFAARAAQTYTGGDMIALSGNAFSVDLASTSGLESTNPGNAAGQLRVKLEASNPSLQIDGSNQLGAKLDAAGAIVSGAGGLAVQVDDSTIEIATNELQVKDLGISTAKLADDSVTKEKINADVAGDGLQQNLDGSLELSLAAAGALEIVSDDLSVKVDAATVKINGSNNLEALKEREEQITLAAGDITNQYVDLAHAVWGSSASVNSVSLFVVGGPMQQKTVDYTVSLTGGAGGVTRITFAGELATAGAAALESGDVLVIKYSYLT